MISRYSIISLLGNEEFLLFTNRSHIHRYVFDQRQDVRIPLAAVPHNILTVEYNYASDCIFWTDGRYSTIQVRA